MLVLTRRAGESFLIGSDIEITVIEMQGDKAKIGISAPRNVAILRRELLEAVKAANAEAAEADVSIDSLGSMIEGK